jgi:hypothetical protein
MLSNGKDPHIVTFKEMEVKLKEKEDIIAKLKETF